MAGERRLHGQRPPRLYPRAAQAARAADKAIEAFFPELDVLQEALCLDDIRERGLELYFNGERGLTEFVISCYVCEHGFWKNVGKYTPDFLLIERREGAIHRALILETKGAGYSNDPVFLKKKAYAEGEFWRQNNERFGYRRFDCLYLEDSASMAENLSHLSERVREFFEDAPQAEGQ